MAHVYHWKHGWIPLDHTAALSKAKGNHEAATRMLGDASGGDVGIRTKQDVAKATLDLVNVTKGDHRIARAEVVAAAHRLGASDILPKHMQDSHIVLYHGTASHNVENIQNNGIDTKHSAGWLTLTDSVEQAAYYANHTGSVVEFHVPRHLVHSRGNKDAVIWHGREHTSGGVTATAHAVKTNLPGSMIHKVHKAADIHKRKGG